MLRYWRMLWLPLILLAFGVGVLLTFVALGKTQARERLSILFNL